MPAEAAATPILRYNLDAVLDLRAADGLRQRLLELLSENEAICLNASRVKRVSTACVQVIAAFTIAARQSGRQVTITSTSPAFAAGFTSLGLDSIISEEPA